MKFQPGLPGAGADWLFAFCLSPLIISRLVELVFPDILIDRSGEPCGTLLNSFTDLCRRGRVGEFNRMVMVSITFPDAASTTGEYNKMKGIPQVIGSRPPIDLIPLIGSKYPVQSRSFASCQFPEMLDGLPGKAGTGLGDLEIRYFCPVIESPPGEGQFDHLMALPARGTGPPLEWRLQTGHEDYPVQFRFLPGNLRHLEMPEVNRIKRTSENRHPLHSASTTSLQISASLLRPFFSRAVLIAPREGSTIPSFSI